jgi:hypothetical protein
MLGRRKEDLLEDWLRGTGVLYEAIGRHRLFLSSRSGKCREQEERVQRAGGPEERDTSELLDWGPGRGGEGAGE